MLDKAIKMCGRIKCNKAFNAAPLIGRVTTTHTYQRSIHMNPSYIKNALMKTINFMSSDPAPFVNCPDTDFTRKRKCSFSSLIMCMLTMEDHSLNRELREFFSKTEQKPVSKSAFIQQRLKLNHEAFPFLFRKVNSIAAFRKKMYGYHLIAVDGSDINVPPLKDDPDTSVRSNTSQICYHQIHLNAAYDILEERYVDLSIQPRASYDEREALLEFIQRNPLPDKCIYIADRGYFSSDVLAKLFTSKDHFILRLSDGARSFLNRFELPDSEEFDVTLEFSFTRSKKREFLEHPDKYVYVRKGRRFDLIPEDDKDTTFPVSVRLVKIKLPGGDYEYLLTDLPGKIFGIDKLREVYNLRWGIETSFRYLKYNVALNSFHSIRRDLITQEIYSRVILYNLTMLLAHCVTIPQENTKYNRKIAVSDAVVTCRDFLIHRFRNEDILQLLVRYLTDIRPGRSFERKTRSKRFVPLANRV